MPDGRSTLDLFGSWFTLLAGARYDDSVPLSDPVHRHQMHGPATQVYGIADHGAVLVRPDGHVAWRITS